MRQPVKTQRLPDREIAIAPVGPEDMMQLQDIEFSGQNLIEAYGDNGFRLTGGRVEGSILLLPDSVTSLQADLLSDLTLAHFEPVFTADPTIEIMILGTGKKQTFPPIEFRKHFIENNIALEVMDTGAACRTYNILASEDRPVAAGILAV